MRLGCIGIGSNAIRLLVASWKDGQLCDVRRERRGTRLFAGLIGGRLTEESIQSSVNAVDELAQCARGDGAQEIFVFATSAHISLPIPTDARRPAGRGWRSSPARRRRCSRTSARATAAFAA